MRKLTHFLCKNTQTNKLSRQKILKITNFLGKKHKLTELYEKNSELTDILATKITDSQISWEKTHIQTSQMQKFQS